MVQSSPQTIVIQPANPNVVYVPQYNPTMVYGAPIVVPLYRPSVVVAAPVVSYGPAISIGVGFGGGGGGGNVVYQHNTYIHNTTYINNHTTYNNYHPWGPVPHGPAPYGPHPYNPNGFRPNGGVPNGGRNGDHGLIGGNGGTQHTIAGNGGTQHPLGNDGGVQRPDDERQARGDAPPAADPRGNGFAANQARSRMRREPKGIASMPACIRQRSTLKGGALLHLTHSPSAVAAGDGSRSRARKNRYARPDTQREGYQMSAHNVIQ